MAKRTKQIWNLADHGTAFEFSVELLESVTCVAEKTDKSGRLYVRDTETKGLSFCVTESGKRSFYYVRRVGQVVKRIKMGDWPDLTLTNARAAAAQLNNDLAIEKANPIQAAAAKRIKTTLGELWEDYLTHHANKQKRPRSIDEDKSIWKLHLSEWASKPLSTITRTLVEKKHAEMGAVYPTRANRMLALLSTMFNKRGSQFGVKRADNPTTEISKYPEKTRMRILAPDEFDRFMVALEEEDATYRDYFKMLLWTGARRNTVKEMRWEDIHFPQIGQAMWTIPGEKTKNGEQLRVPLLPQAVQVLKGRSKDSPYVFPARWANDETVEKARELAKAGMSGYAIAKIIGTSGTQARRYLSPDFKAAEPAPMGSPHAAFKRVLKRAKITTHTTIHDLRRTFCSKLIEEGTPLPIAASAMGHKTLSMTNKVYTHVQANTLAAWMGKAFPQAEKTPEAAKDGTKAAG